MKRINSWQQGVSLCKTSLKSAGLATEQTQTRGIQDLTFIPNSSETHVQKLRAWEQQLQPQLALQVSHMWLTLRFHSRRQNPHQKQHDKDMTIDEQQTFMGSVADKLVQKKKWRKQQEARSKIYYNNNALENAFLFPTWVQSSRRTAG